jgi:hypothetical protein
MYVTSPPVVRTEDLIGSVSLGTVGASEEGVNSFFLSAGNNPTNVRFTSSSPEILEVPMTARALESTMMGLADGYDLEKLGLGRVLFRGEVSLSCLSLCSMLDKGQD